MVLRYVVSAFAGCLFAFAPFLDLKLKWGPPPDRYATAGFIAGGSLLVFMPSYLVYVYHKARPRLLLVLLVAWTLYWGGGYFDLYHRFNVEDDVTHERVIIGDVLTPEAREIMKQDALTELELLKSNHYKAEAIYTSESLSRIRGASLRAWTMSLIFLPLFALFILPAKPVLENREGLKLIKQASGPATFNVVFLHGVHGNYRTTWESGPGNYWPSWVGEAFPTANVYSLQYNAPVSLWLGGTMTLASRARNILFQLEAGRIFAYPTVFITHSYGGLVIQQLWRHAHEQNKTAVLQAIRSVFFLGTPHGGSKLATLLARWPIIRYLARPSQTARELVLGESSLAELNAFCGANPIPNVFVFQETQKTRIGQIVTEKSADPCFPNVEPIPMYADHLQLCKPHPDDPIVSYVNQRIAEVMGLQPNE